MRVLVAEDDDGLRSVLGRGLRENHYVVDAVRDGEEAVRFLRGYEYELVVLDWRMPGDVRPGRRALDAAVTNGPTPVLMLTARDAPADRVTGLDEGADDYLIKPFDFAELLARMRALQLRPSAVQQPGARSGRPPASIRRPGKSAWAAKQPVLTATEYGILELLIRRSPRVVARKTIAVHVWDDESDVMGSNTIDVHLARLRAKLAGGMVRIETVRGIGYRMVGR